MATGSFWNLSNPLKPWGYHDPDSIIFYPMDWSEWLADAQTTYASHSVSVDSPLEIVSSAQSAGVVSILVGTMVSGVPVIGQKYALTCHIVCADGQEEEQTVYLKIREK